MRPAIPRIRSLFTLPLLATLFLCSEDPASPDELREELQPTGTISGRVFTMAGDPIAGVLVSINADSATPGITNDTGAFVIGRVLTGTYTLSFTHREFENDSSWTVTVGTDESVAIDDSIRLAYAYHVIRGTIVKDGIPVDGAGISPAHTMQTALSEADGSFLLDRVPKNMHLRLICAKSSVGYNVKVIEQSALEPDTTDIGDIELDKTGADVSGTVYSLLEQPLPGAVVSCVGGAIRGRSDQNGAYVLRGVPSNEPGVYISAASNDSSLVGGLTGMMLADGAVASGVDIYLHRPGQLINGMALSAGDILVADTADSVALTVFPSTDITTTIEQYLWYIAGSETPETTATSSHIDALSAFTAAKRLAKSTGAVAESSITACAVTVVARNSDGDESGPLSFRVRIRNSAPRIRSIAGARRATGPFADTLTLNAGDAAFFRADAEDPLGGLDSAVWRCSGAPGEISHAPVFPATVTWTFDSAGEHVVRLRVVDTDGNVAADSMRVSVNAPPAFVAPSAAAVSIPVDSSLALALHADDPDGDSVTYHALVLPSFGSLDHDTLRIEPDSADTGAGAILAVAADGRGGADTLVLQVSVLLRLSSDARLGSLTADIGTLSPSFDPDSLTYELVLPEDSSEVRLAATPRDSTATVRIDNVYLPDSAWSPPVGVAPGDTDTVVIHCTAQDGESEREYRVAVIRPHATNLALSFLGIAPGGTLLPAFDPDTLVYTARIGATVQHVQIAPLAASPQATVTVNGTVVPGGQASSFITVAEDDTIRVRVSTPGTSETRTYLLVVSRGASSNAWLAALLSSSGALTPAFHPDTAAYTDSVGEALTALHITPTAFDSNATIMVDGDTVQSGARVGPLALVGGDNTFGITVVAEDGVTSRQYTLAVYRAYGTNAQLSALLTPAGKLSPSFDPTVSLYRDTVPFEQAVYPVQARPVDPNAQVIIDATPVAPADTHTVTLAAGTTPVSIVVLSESGSDTSQWLLEITRQSDVALSSLTVPPHPIVPEFHPETLSYTATVENHVASLSVAPIARSVGTSTIRVNGIETTSGTASEAIGLVVGENTVTVRVDGVDGFSSRTYSVTITRKPSTDATLASLAVSQGTLTPSFTDTISDYTDTVDIEVTSITLTPRASHAAAGIRVNGAAVASGEQSPVIPLDYGPNAVTIEVVAEDESTTRTYTCTVVRMPNTDANLASLTLSGTVLSPSFDSLTTAYTAHIPYQTNAVTLTPTAAEPRATIRVNGTVVPSGSPSGSIDAAVGENTITVEVTALDTTVAKSYTVTLTRSPRDSLVNGMLVTGDDTLRASGSPYHFVKGLSIQPGASLVIEPGVTLLLDSGIAIDVNGLLIADGTESDSIVFTAYNTAKRWGYMRFGPDAANAEFDAQGVYTGGSIVSYAAIEYAGNSGKKAAVKLDRSCPFLAFCSIRRNSKGGIFRSGEGGYKSNLRIQGCSITMNDGPGINIKGYSDGNDTNRIVDCTISHNASQGNGAGITNDERPVLIIDRCRLMHNSAEGRNARGGGIAHTGNNLIVKHCVVSGNSAGYYGGGFYIGNPSQWDGRTTIDSCLISNNSAQLGGGLTVNHGFGEHAHVTLDFCRVDSNTAENKSAIRHGGIWDGRVSHCTFRHNRCTGSGNTWTLSVYDSPPGTMGNNNFLGNDAAYELYNNTSQGSSNIDATNNYWGTTNENEIKALIYDWFDDNSKGIVEYAPYLTEPNPDCPDTSWTPLP